MIAAVMLRAGLLLPTAFAVAGLAILCGLGTWQVQRMQWKRDLVALMSSRLKSPEIDAGEVAALGCFERPGAADPCEYRAVRVTGRFRHDGERHVFIALDGKGGGPAGPGYWIFTPLDLDGGRVVYVNRGFAPQAQKSASAREAGLVSGPVTIGGVLRRPEVRGTFSAANDARGNIWFVRSPAEFAAGPAAASDAEKALYIQQTVPILPRGVAPQTTPFSLDLPNRHLEYALTWFGLAATLVGVYLAFAVGRIRSAYRSGG